jgi:hypothetical protein
VSALRRAFTQGSLYTLFQGLGMAVSLISFPILTRILPVEEYSNLAISTRPCLSCYRWPSATSQPPSFVPTLALRVPMKITDDNEQ